MARQRHFVNRTPEGACVFVTTTVLDFVPVFSQPNIADAMVDSLFTTCKREECLLYAYVVMPEHVHAVIQLRPDLHVVQLMNRLKSLSARQIRPILSPKSAELFSQQTGLGRRTFWQRSFRSFSADTQQLFSQKVNYTHWNPVKRGLSDSPQDYEWSSALLWERNLWSSEEGLVR
ncbi:MAG: transposase [Armatimonadetes bacterium]|nr:transposase [Armatimonadota bacterium]